MISWNVSSGTGITWICAPDVLAVTERVNTSDGQWMTGWPLGPPWGVDRGGPLWWRNSVSMKEEERERDWAWGERGWEKGTRHPEDPSSLTGCRRGRSTGLDCSRPVPPLCGLRGAPAASANFRLAQTCELLGANWNMIYRKAGWGKERKEGSGMYSGGVQMVVATDSEHRFKVCTLKLKSISQVEIAYLCTLKCMHTRGHLLGS